MSLVTMIGPTVQTVLGRVKAKAMRMRDQRTAHARAVVYIDRWIKVNFEEEGSPAMGGSGWVPLKAATIKRRRHGKGKGAAGVRILQDVGWLKNKWKPYYSPMKVAYQSMMPYGIYHDSDKLPRKRLPQRRIVPRYKQVAATLRKIYLGYMKEVLSGRS